MYVWPIQSRGIVDILQYIPRNMNTVFALLYFVVVIYWLIFPYPSGLLHWHCGNLTIAPVPANQPWWIWINTSCEFIMNDCITTTKQSTTKPGAYFLGYTVHNSGLHSGANISKLYILVWGRLLTIILNVRKLRLHQHDSHTVASLGRDHGYLQYLNWLMYTNELIRFHINTVDTGWGWGWGFSKTFTSS